MDIDVLPPKDDELPTGTSMLSFSEYLEHIGI